MYPVDLHTHTTRSDGKDTPAESLHRAAGLGIKIMAICDHDIVPAEFIETEGAMKRAEDYAASLGVTLIPGIEISCDTRNEDVHIVGLGCRWGSPWFAEYDRFVQKSKINGYHAVIEALGQHGYHITMEEVLIYAGIEGRPEKLQKKFIFELMAKKGYAQSWSDAKRLIQGTPALNPKREKPDPCAVIAALHAAGGLAILAHPYLIDKRPLTQDGTVPRSSYIDSMVSAGLDGIEARYTYDKTNYKGGMTNLEIYSEICGRYSGLILSGGSDYHADYRQCAGKCRELGEAGLTLEEFFACPKLAALVR